MSDQDEVNDVPVGDGVTAAPDSGDTPEQLAGAEAIEVTTESATVVAADVVAAGNGSAAARAQAAEDDEERQAVAFGWAYLAILAVIFGVLAALAYSCDPDEVESTSPAVTTTEVAETVVVVEAMPIALVYTVDEGAVTLAGAVPDEGARSQLVELAIARYGDANVVDELTIDDLTTLTGGTIAVSGSATDGDDNPQGLQADAIAALGLADAGFDVGFEAVPLSPVDAEAALSAGQVVLSGVLPDQPSLDSLVAAAEGTWGAENVDATGLSVGETTWADGQIRVIGTIDAGDARGDAFAEALAGVAAGVAVETSGLTIDSGAEALARSEAQLQAALAANPIQFALGSAEIDPASDAILTEAAAAITAAPGINVAIVGHTDSLGGEAANQQLSADRAEAVLNRLVELGVEAERLTSSGAGASEPIADNETEEGRGQNRRIAFEFEGAASGAEADTAEDTEESE